MNSKRKQKTATSHTKFYSKYHRGRKCSDCALCGQAVTNVTHFETWGGAEQNFVLKHSPGKELTSSSCICKAHYVEAKRYCTQNGYVPKWKKGTEPVGRVEKSLVCSHPHCSTTSAEARLIVPHFDSPENIKLALGIMEDNLLELVLCPRHYTEVHKQLMYPQPCASCGLKPKKGTRFVRYCPDTTAINQILFENTGSTQRLQNSDQICSSCYKSHVVVLKSLGDVMVPNELLEDDTARWEHQLSQTSISQLNQSNFDDCFICSQRDFASECCSSARDIRCVHGNILTSRCSIVIRSSPKC